MPYHLNKKIIFISFIAIFLSSCNSTPVRYNNICSLLDSKISWYKALKKVEKKRGVSMSLILAFIKQESSFNFNAKPKNKKVFGFIPVGKQSSAYGFSQAKSKTWNWYKINNNKDDVSRSNFADSSDFIAWYVKKSQQLTGIGVTDVYNQYLAYHEGQSGFKNGSYNQKPWLKEVAKKVLATAKNYENNLKKCRKKLDNTYSWSYF